MIQKSVNLTAEGKKELEAELAELKKQRPEIAERIATAREFGDLKENEEYSSARNEQKLAESRTKVALGSKVKISMGGKNVEYLIVGTVEANPGEGKISDESPIGKKLMGRKAGDSFDLNGKTVKVLELN